MQPMTQPAGQPAQAMQPQGGAAPKQNNRMKVVEKIALAGKQILYDPKMKGKLLARLDPEDPPTSAADVAMAAILLIIQKSQGKVAPDSIVPAGLVLVGEVLDFMEKTKGIEVTEELTEQAITAFVEMALQTFSQKGGEQAQGQPPGQPPMSGVSPQPQQPQPQPPGLLGGAA